MVKTWLTLTNWETLRLDLDAAELGSTREAGTQPVKHEEAGVDANAVSRFGNDFGAIVATLVRIQDALESAGVVFIPADQPGQVSAFAKRPPIELSENGHVEDRRSEPSPAEPVATMGNEANYGSAASRVLWRSRSLERNYLASIPHAFKQPQLLNHSVCRIQKAGMISRQFLDEAVIISNEQKQCTLARFLIALIGLFRYRGLAGSCFFFFFEHLVSELQIPHRIRAVVYCLINLR